MDSASAILLGASLFPHHSYVANPAFATSKNDFLSYLKSQSSGLGIPHSQILDLFDSDLSAASQVMAIATFLEGPPALISAPKDLIVYYVGHGLFSGARQDYMLAVRDLKENFDALTGLKISDLSDVLKTKGRKFRKYIILDCCFAGEALGMFQAQGSQAAMRKTIEAFDSGKAQRKNRIPSTGTALYGAADKYSVALSPSHLPRTMFTDALLRVLSTGDPLYPERMTLANLHEATWEYLQKAHSTPVKPILHAPDQSDGDISVAVALFGNLAHARDAQTVSNATTPFSVIKRADLLKKIRPKWLQLNIVAIILIAFVSFFLVRQEYYKKDQGREAPLSPQIADSKSGDITSKNQPIDSVKQPSSPSEVIFKSKFMVERDLPPSFSPSGELAMFNFSRELIVVDVQSLSINKIGTLGSILAGAFTEDERSVQLVVAEGDQREHIKIQTYDILDGKKKNSINWGTVASALGADIARDGQTAILSAQERPGNWMKVYAIDFPSGKKRLEQSFKASADSEICINSDGSAAFFSADDGLRKFYTETGKYEKVPEMKGDLQVHLKCQISDDSLANFYKSLPVSLSRNITIYTVCPNSGGIIFEVFDTFAWTPDNRISPEYYSFTPDTKIVTPIILPLATWGAAICSEKFKKIIFVSSERIASRTFSEVGWK